VNISHLQVRAAGFSLVETALAMLVAGIGLTAILALLPAAMDQGKKASDETFAAFFADAVFNSFHAALWDTNISWAGLANYETIPPVTLTGGEDVFWKDSAKMTVRMDGLIRTQKFIAGSARGKWATGVSMPSTWEQYDHALRYRLSSSLLTQRRRQLALEVWPGEFGQTNNPYRFVTELFNHGF
jgi:hypothetical protein